MPSLIVGLQQNLKRLVAREQIARLNIDHDHWQPGGDTLGGALVAWEFQRQIVMKLSHFRNREPGRIMRESAQHVATI
jgi:hypothetical protein